MTDTTARQLAVAHPDGHHRCPWPGQDAAYLAYHDDEWGVPEFDSRALFEKLLLDGFQAGLSWISILRKRENFRVAFDGFDPETIAAYDSAKVERLMADAGIIRNRAKITGAVFSARLYLDLEANQGFSNYLWDFVDGRPIVNHFRAMEEVPAPRPCRKNCPGTSKSAASNSAARPSFTLSCRRSAWSTIISWTATGMWPVRLRTEARHE